jgi:hypothetical protein
MLELLQQRGVAGAIAMDLSSYLVDWLRVPRSEKTVSERAVRDHHGGERDRAILHSERQKAGAFLADQLVNYCREKHLLLRWRPIRP